MKTALKVIDDVTNVLSAAVLPLLDGGKTYPVQAPLNMGGKFIVINTLGTSNEYNQFSIPNVNIHVPNLKIPLPNGEGNDNTRPNLAVFDTLVSTVMPLLKSHIGPDFRINVRDDVGLIRDSDGSWYYSIKLNYWSLQESNKNI